MTAPKAAMVLGAGFGTRMGALTANQPKPLVRVAGRALIDHALDRVAEGGAARAVVNLHYLGGQIRAHLMSRHDLKITFSPEDPVLETGGGVVQALPLLGAAPFFVVNSDAIWRGAPPLPPLVGAWDRARMGALLHLAPRERAHAHAGRGDFFVGGDGRLSRRGSAAEAPYVYTGAHITDPSVFAGAPAGAFSLNLIWDRLIAEGRLFGQIYDGDWVDVGGPAGLAAAERMLA